MGIGIEFQLVIKDVILLIVVIFDVNKPK